MQRGIGRLRARASNTFSPSQITFTTGLWLDPSDISTGFQDSAGTTPQTASAQPTGKRLDKSGNANHVLQATSANRPEYDLISGVASDYFDGTNDGLLTGAAAFGSSMDCFIALRRINTTQIVLCYPTTTIGSFYFANFVGGSAGQASLGCGTPTYVVNGVDVPGGTAPTRAQLDTAIPVNSWCVLEVRNLDLSNASWNAFGFAGATSVLMNGDIGGVILCPAQSSTNRTNIRRWLGAKVGLSL